MKKLRDNGLKTTMSPEKKMLEKVYLMLVNWNLTKPRIGVNGKPLKEGDKVILDKLEISRENVHKLQKEVWESIKTFVQTVEDKLIGNAQIKN